MSSPGDRLPKDLPLAEFREFRDYIQQHSGIYLEDSKLDSLRISLLTRATRLDCPGWSQYLDVLSRDEAEFRELMSLITINETSFFRFPGQFEALRARILPEIASERTGDSRALRMWSAGCSTGEEPYSIAMTFLDSGLEGAGWRGEVMGTDVSTKALATAKAGIYQQRHLANVPDETIARHFERTDDGYRLAPHVRNICDFTYQNLIKEPYPTALLGNWDVIFCRNVTIYFRLESTRRVVQNFHDSLNDGGYLFVGHSETLTTITDQFESVEVGGVFLYRKRRARRIVAVGRAETGTERRARERAAGPTPERRTAAVVDRPAMPERRASGPTPPVPSPAAAPSPAPADAARLPDLLVAAHAHADAGEYDRARSECQAALAQDPLLAGARYLLGVIQQSQGDVASAVTEFKKTIYIDPQFVLAHLNLANIHKSQSRYEDACRGYENALRALYVDPEGAWTRFLGGWQADVILRTCERSLLECRKAMGAS